MDYYLKTLENKWGQFEKDKYYLKQCDMSDGRKVSYLNVLFNPVKRKDYEVVEKILDCKLLPSLEKFYEQYNGIMLFFESFRIYGVETGKKALYDSCDILEQNAIEDIQSLKPEFENMIIFGYYSSCLFCYDKKELSTIYVIETKTEKIIHKFKDIIELLDYYVDNLTKMYDTNGKKINYNPRYKDLPMANISNEII